MSGPRRLNPSNRSSAKSAAETSLSMAISGRGRFSYASCDLPVSGPPQTWILAPVTMSRLSSTWSRKREAGDALEMLVPQDLWPLPTYREMLFVK